jgi:CYTH domain-containing protein
MAKEIERKFLIKPGVWKPVTPGLTYRQGYLSSVNERVVRVRVAGDKAFLTIKGITQSLSRLEFEYPIPMADAVVMLDQLCEPPLIDVFHGHNDGLIVAEIELSSETDTFDRPQWVGEEVSNDPRYFNNNLAVNPFKVWGCPHG